MLNGTFPARVDGGPGRVSVERLPYFPEQILAALKGTEHLILVGGEIPASFFAYRGIPGQMVPEGCKVSRLSFIEEDSFEALQRVAERLGAMQSEVTRFQKADIGKPTGELDNKSTVQAIAATMPEDVIVCTDSGGGNAAYPFCQNTAPNSWLSLTGAPLVREGPVRRVLRWPAPTDRCWPCWEMAVPLTPFSASGLRPENSRMSPP